jgi:nicotinamidase-related amidase
MVALRPRCPPPRSPAPTTMDEISLRALRAFSGVGEVRPWAAETALLVVDMQRSCTDRTGFTARRLAEVGLADLADDYVQRVDRVTAQLALVLERARAEGIRVVHTRVVSLPGRQPGGQRSNARHVARGDVESEFTPRLEPRDGELVVDKACSGVFAGTNLHYVLGRLGVTSLVVGGVVTNGCVEQAITHAHDLGYACVLLGDGSTAHTEAVHQNALDRLAVRRAHVLSAAELLDTSLIEATTRR